MDTFMSFFLAGNYTIIVSYLTQEPDDLFLAADKINDLARPGHFETCPDVPCRPSGVAAVIYDMIIH